MKAKKSLIFLVSAGVAAVVLLLVGFMLVRAAAKLRASEKQLKQRRSELAGYYYKRNPFPSDGNVEREDANRAELDKWFEALIGKAREGQIRLDKHPSPTTFMGLLGKTRNQLAARAESLKIRLPGDFNFGFDRYFKSSTLPAAEHVPRLLQQLVIVQSLCQILYGEGVAEISSLERQEFEGGGGGGGRASKALNVPDAGVLKEGALYSRFHFALELKAREQVLLNTLNKLASHELFIVVTNLELRNPVSAVKLPSQEAARPSDEEDDGTVEAVADAEAPTDPVDIPRSQRMVSGLPLEQPLLVSLELDVYSFREKAQDGEVSP